MILNAFSLNMLKHLTGCVEHEEISREEAAAMAQTMQSAVGHADTAAVFANVLGVPVPFNRANVSLDKGDVALVGQFIGPRLPEGATTLPAGATIKWLRVTIA